MNRYVLLIAVTLSVAMGLHALGQSLPAVNGGQGFYYGFEPSAEDLNSYFHAKQDWPLPAYTVATLPTCGPAIARSLAVITDATTPTYNGTPVGGGAVIVPVFCNGTVWTTH